MSPQQQRFWNELTQLRGVIEYLCLYELSCERIDRGIKIFLAVTSSGSIAAWAIWRDLAPIWAVLIAGSQFINASKEHLPFERRLRAARQLTTKLEGLFVQWETKWNEIANGELSEADINSQLADLKKATVDLIGSCLSDGSLPDRPKLHATAAAKAVLYFETIYATGEDDDQEAERHNTEDGV